MEGITVGDIKVSFDVNLIFLRRILIHLFIHSSFIIHSFTNPYFAFYDYAPLDGRLKENVAPFPPALFAPHIFPP